MPFYQFEGLGAVDNYLVFLKNHWLVSAKDALIVLALYLITGILIRNLSWGRRMVGPRLTIFWVLGALWAIVIEYQALDVGRWAYVETMPILPVLEVGLLPVLQMIIVPTLAVLITRKHLDAK